MAPKARVRKGDLELLRKHGIRYSVHRGELFIDSRDWRKYDWLCEEGKLPRSVC